MNWCEYETAYGRADKDIKEYVKVSEKGYIPKIEKQLTDLFSENKDVSLQASHDLWANLCHQYSFISSVSLPSYDF